MKNTSARIWVRTLFLVAAAAAIGMGVGPIAARATLPHAISSSLSFAGSLHQGGVAVAQGQVIKFTFKKNGAAVCSPPEQNVTPDEEGQFVAPIPIEGCPMSLFDGTDVKLDISVGGELAVVDQPITSVPAAKYAEHAGYPDCPLGYVRDATASAFVLCRSGSDEVVRVGSKGSAFWIDRYESSIWENLDGSGRQLGDNKVDYPADPGAQGATGAAMYAFSKVNVNPSVYMTWYQASFACRQSGKRLPTSDEWLLAAQNTPDPGSSEGISGECFTNGTGPRKTGLGTVCASKWGAQDMIGNVFEWTSEWQAAPSVAPPAAAGSWGPSYADDMISNVVSGSTVVQATWSDGFPAATVRGGSFFYGRGAGIFAYVLGFAPTYASFQIGTRCVTPR